MPYSKSQNKATQKYIKNAYDEIKVRVPKGTKQIYKDKANKQGLSLNAYVISLLNNGLIIPQKHLNSLVSVKQVAASMAIEDMYFDKDFINKICKVAQGEISSESLREEIINQYAR